MKYANLVLECFSTLPLQPAGFYVVVDGVRVAMISLESFEQAVEHLKQVRVSHINQK